MAIEKVFQANLKRLMAEENQLAVSETAKELGYSLGQQYLSRLISGKRVNPSLKKMSVIAEALGVRVADLVLENGIQDEKHARLQVRFSRLLKSEQHGPVLEKIIEAMYSTAQDERSEELKAAHDPKKKRPK